MEHEVEKYSVGAVTVKIIHDSDCEEPSSDDEAVKIVICHRRFTNPSPDVGGDADEVMEWVKANRKEWYVTNLFMYEHGNVALRAGERNPFGCQWDSGQVGIIAIKKSEFGRGKGERNAKRLEWCKNIAEEYGQWMNGECYGYVIEDEDGEQLDSCWGYIGLDYAKEEANSAAKHHAEEVAEIADALTDAENNYGAGI